MRLFNASCLLSGLLFCAPLTLAQGQSNVILIIGDGMDDHQITIARNYLEGAQGRLLLDQMPVRSTSQVLTIENDVGGKPVYVADSANTGTTMATGVITSRGRISTTAGDDRDIPTIVELAAAAGYKTGIVSTASVTDATPAVFAAHISLRFCENPDSMVDIRYKDIPLGDCSSDLQSNGGPGSISEQLVASPLDVILGGGSKHFVPNGEGKSQSVLKIAQQNGFQTVVNAAQLDASSAERRLLGLFSPGTMPVRMQGQNGRAAEAPEPSLLNWFHEYLGDVTQPEPMVCEPNPNFAEVPSLKQMTDTAIRHLSHGNSRGFFLMIESASIDKQSHERKPCGSIGELEQLQEALASALDFATTHPETLIMVTADHAQAAQLIPYDSLFSEFPIPIFSPGKLARIITPEGGYMAVNYATTNFIMEEHTGANVPLFSNEVGRDLVPSFVQQPDIFTIMLKHLRLD